MGLRAGGGRSRSCSGVPGEACGYLGGGTCVEERWAEVERLGRLSSE